MALQVTRTPSRMESNGPYLVEVFDDFFTLNISATTGAADYQLTETAAGATQLLSATESGGVLVLTQAANDNDVIDISANAGVKTSDLKPGEPYKFFCRFRTEDADDVDLHIGLNIKDASMQAGAAADYVMFRLQEGGAGLDLVVSKDSNVTTIDNIATVIDGEYVYAEFIWKPDPTTTDTGQIQYRVICNDLISQGAATVPGNFPDDVVLFKDFQVQNGTTAADVSAIDFWGESYILPASVPTDG